MKLNEKSLWQNIKSEEYYPVYLIKGGEGYLKQKYANLLADSVVPAGLWGFNYHKLDGDKTSVEEIADCAMALPAMCEKTCVLIHDFDFASLSESEKDTMTELFSDPNETCVLVFWQDTRSFPSKTKAQKELLKLIEKNGAVVDLDSRSHGDLVKFIGSECKKQGKAISYRAAEYFLETVGEDMSNLVNEIDKVCNYAADEITEKHIDEISTKSLESTAFKMIDALMAGDYQSVFSSLSILFEQKQEPMMILGALVSTYTDMYRAKIVSKAGERPAVLKDYFPQAYKSDFKLKNAVRRSSGFSVGTLRASLELLGEADKKLKSTSEDSKIVLEKLLVELGEVRRNA